MKMDIHAIKQECETELLQTVRILINKYMIILGKTIANLSHIFRGKHFQHQTFFFISILKSQRYKEEKTDKSFHLTDKL